VRRRDRQKGAAAVEFALTLPALLLIIAGSVYLARALHARGRLVDAVAFAARSEAIAAAKNNGQVDNNSILKMINGKMQDDTDCVLPVEVHWDAYKLPVPYLTIHATCTLQTPILGAFLGPITANQVAADASMPIDYDATN
jgi:Flp pilus assembly protein TadG